MRTRFYAENTSKYWKTLRSYAGVRMRRLAGRFARRVADMSVLIERLREPRGEDDWRCRIDASVAPFRRVIVETLDRNPFAALDRAASRVSWNVAQLRRIEETSRRAT